MTYVLSFILGAVYGAVCVVIFAAFAINRKPEPEYLSGKRDD